MVPVSANVCPMSVRIPMFLTALRPKTSGWIRPCSWRLVTDRFRGRVSVSQSESFTRLKRVSIKRLFQNCYSTSRWRDRRTLPLTLPCMCLPPAFFGWSRSWNRLGLPITTQHDPMTQPSAGGGKLNYSVRGEPRYPV